MAALCRPCRGRRRWMWPRVARHFDSSCRVTALPSQVDRIRRCTTFSRGATRSDDPDDFRTHRRSGSPRATARVSGLRRCLRYTPASIAAIVKRMGTEVPITTEEDGGVVAHLRHTRTAGEAWSTGIPGAAPVLTELARRSALILLDRRATGIVTGVIRCLFAGAI